MSQIGFQRVCAWSGIVCLSCFFGAFFAGHFIPPLAPSLSAQEVADHYQTYTTGIRFGSALMLLAGMFYVAYCGCISAQIARIPGVGPAVRYTQLGAGVLACVTFLMPALVFFVTAYRPDRDPELTLMLNDMAWIITIVPFPPFVTQYFAFGFAIFSDRRERPLFPRWLGYLNVWAPTVYMSAVVAAFVKTGPFTWAGLIVFWLAGVVFSTQFISNFLMLRRALDDEAGQLEQSSANQNVDDTLRPHVSAAVPVRVQ